MSIEGSLQVDLNRGGPFGPHVKLLRYKRGGAAASIIISPAELPRVRAALEQAERALANEAEPASRTTWALMRPAASDDGQLELGRVG